MSPRLPPPTNVPQESTPRADRPSGGPAVRPAGRAVDRPPGHSAGHALDHRAGDRWPSEQVDRSLARASCTAPAPSTRTNANPPHSSAAIGRREFRRHRALPLALVAVLALAGCASPSAPPPTAALPPLKTVASVDLSRYVGTWHEIARYPFGIQDRHCARDTTADYALLASGEISVVNRCLRSDDGIFVADGVAWIVDEQSRARLQVSFLPPSLRSLPIGRGDYWIIELAPDYGWVVIGEPGRRYLWILARSPSLPRDTLAGILGRLASHGYDRSRVIASPGREALP